jgi:alpha-tubulin suppressor-like RCC1 family protein
LNKDGKLLYTGKKNDTTQSRRFVDYPKSLPHKVAKFELGIMNTICLTEKGQFYAEGSNKNEHFGADKIVNDFTYLPRQNEETETVVDFDIGDSFHFYVTDNGKLYGMGNTLLDLHGLPRLDGIYTHIPLPENLVPVKVK